MSQTLNMQRRPPPNVNNVAPFDELIVYSGQQTCDGSGGDLDFDMGVLVSGTAAHVYFLGLEISSTDAALDGDFGVFLRSVNPQWNMSENITTTLSTIAVMKLTKHTGANFLGLEPVAQLDTPKYLGQVTSAGSALLRVGFVNATSGSITSLSLRLGIAKEFVRIPPDLWPLYS